VWNGSRLWVHQPDLPDRRRACRLGRSIPATSTPAARRNRAVPHRRSRCLPPHPDHRPEPWLPAPQLTVPGRGGQEFRHPEQPWCPAERFV